MRKIYRTIQYRHITAVKTQQNRRLPKARKHTGHFFFWQQIMNGIAIISPGLFLQILNAIWVDLTIKYMRNI